MVKLTLGQRVLVLLAKEPGLTDRELADRLLGTGAGPQQVNQACRGLAAAGRIERKERPHGLTGNYLRVAALSGGLLLSRRPSSAGPASPEVDEMQEDEVKGHVESWLNAQGWQVEVQWGSEPGADVEAIRASERWVIVARGCGPRPQMQEEYFLAVLGATLLAMEDPTTRYSIALPDLSEYRELWQRLPDLAKSRTQITMLAVRPDGKVEEVK